MSLMPVLYLYEISRFTKLVMTTIFELFLVLSFDGPTNFSIEFRDNLFSLRRTY